MPTFFFKLPVLQVKFSKFKTRCLKFKFSKFSRTPFELRDRLFSLNTSKHVRLENDNIVLRQLSSDISLSVTWNNILAERCGKDWCYICLTVVISIVEQKKMHNLTIVLRQEKRRERPRFYDSQLNFVTCMQVNTNLHIIDRLQIVCNTCFRTASKLYEQCAHKITVEWMSRVQIKLGQCVHLSRVVWHAYGASSQCDFYRDRLKDVEIKRDIRAWYTERISRDS